MRQPQRDNSSRSVNVTFRRVCIALFSVTVLALVWAPGQAADALILEPVIQIIEAPSDPLVGVRTHWRIRLNEPNRSGSTPQIIAVMTPNGTINGDYMILELNHSTLPNYSSGGLQVQVWSYDQERFWTDAYSKGANCQTTGEDLQFTMEITLVDDKTSPTGKRLWFKVLDLRSDTWGEAATVASFGVATKLTSLAGFSPVNCISESGVTAGSSRVEYMKIDSIDYLYASGREDGDSTDYPLHSVQTQIDSNLDIFTLDKVTAY